MKKSKIVFIGNSIVNGFPHKRSECFVSLFREATGHEVINKGANGETSPQALSRFEKDVIAHKPDRVYFLGGTNDYIYNICSPEETLNYYDKIVELSVLNGIEPILMVPLMIDMEMAKKCWIPDVNYQKVVENLVILRDLMLSYGKEKKVKIIDSQSFFKGLYNEDTKDRYLRDGIHPTVLGHRAIADLLVSEEI
ncbi:MAG: GDSL-type esterase/lipase family protein [Anaerovoracaceae bacterium]|jgi:acyl-CoA thioesterase-1